MIKVTSDSERFALEAKIHSKETELGEVFAELVLVKKRMGAIETDIFEMNAAVQEYVDKKLREDARICRTFVVGQKLEAGMFRLMKDDEPTTLEVARVGKKFIYCTNGYRIWPETGAVMDPATGGLEVGQLKGTFVCASCRGWGRDVSHIKHCGFCQGQGIVVRS